MKYIKKVSEKCLFIELYFLDKAYLTCKERVDKLQGICSGFKYPEILSSCSIYLQDSIDLLIAMQEAIDFLKEKVCINK